MADLKWFAVYTKAKKEEMVVKLLTDAKLNCFNPKLMEKKLIRGKLTSKISSLFPCYIFIQFDKDTTLNLVKYTSGVRFVVGHDTPIPVNQEIIEIIQSKLVEGICEINQDAFRPGERVKIINGPFKGLVGIFEENLKARDRVIIFLDIISKQTKISISQNDISPYEKD